MDSSPSPPQAAPSSSWAHSKPSLPPPPPPPQPHPPFLPIQIPHDAVQILPHLLLILLRRPQLDQLPRWSSAHSILIDQALSCLNKREFPLKLHLIVFLEEFSDPLFTSDPASLPKNLHRLIETLRALIQTPADGVHITLALKEQTMLSVTAIVIAAPDYMISGFLSTCTIKMGLPLSDFWVSSSALSRPKSHRTAWKR